MENFTESFTTAVDELIYRNLKKHLPGEDNQVLLDLTSEIRRDLFERYNNDKYSDFVVTQDN